MQMYCQNTSNTRQLFIRLKGKILKLLKMKRECKLSLLGIIRIGSESCEEVENCAD